MKKSFRKGLEAFPVDVDIMFDEKIIALNQNYGGKAIAFLFALLCEIYRKGYYLNWNDLIRNKLFILFNNTRSEDINNYVKFLVNVGFFDKEAFERDSVLTSSAIQERYFAQMRHYQEENLPHLLITLPPKPQKPAPKPKTVAPAVDSDPDHDSDSSLLPGYTDSDLSDSDPSPLPGYTDSDPRDSDSSPLRGYSDSDLSDHDSDSSPLRGYSDSDLSDHDSDSSPLPGYSDSGQHNHSSHFQLE